MKSGSVLKLFVIDESVLKCLELVLRSGSVLELVVVGVSVLKCLE